MAGGFVEYSDRVAFEVMDTSLTNPHVAYGHEPRALPIYSMGIVAKR
jgi:hypothetical protein